jgi:protein SCO1/2
MRLSLLTSLILTACLSAFADPRPLPDNSLYQLESVWNGDDGGALHLKDLRGKTRILSMFFSHCDNICPMITGQLKTLEREMPADLRTHVGFLLVTLDPESDDSGSLAEFRQRMDFATDSWTLLRGSADDTRELANLLGVTFMPKKNDGQIDHTGLIVILDAEGRIAEKFIGIADRKTFLERLRRTVDSARN